MGSKNLPLANHKLYDFLGLISKAEASILERNKRCELLIFNGFRSVTQFRQSLEEMSDHAFYSYLNSVVNGSVYTIYYHNCLMNHIEEILSNFTWENEQPVYRKLVVKDLEDRFIEYEDLSEDSKEKIGDYLTVIYDVLMSFYSQLNQPEGVEDVIPVLIEMEGQEKSMPVNLATVAETPAVYPKEKLEEGVKWMDNQEVSQLLKCSIRTIQRYRDKGLLHSTRIRGKIYYLESDVMGLMKRNYR